MRTSKSLLIPLPDFQRISQTILRVLKTENANVATSCLFFGIAGAAILARHYRIEARAVVGSAAYNLGGSQVIAFADLDATVPLENQRFHCWVEAHGWFLDFASLVFPEITASAGQPRCPRLMFQKPLHQAALTFDELHTKGVFYALPDQARTERKILDFCLLQANRELIEIAVQTFVKPPMPMPQFGIKDQHGHAKPAVVASEQFLGAW